MNERQAKKHLTRMLESFTVGSVLHLLADLQHQTAEKARLADDATRFEQAKLVQHTLIVVGMGVDSAQPSG